MSSQGVVKRRPQRTTNSALRYSADRDISPKENGFAYSSRDDSQVGPQAAQGLRASLLGRGRPAARRQGGACRQPTRPTPPCIRAHARA